MGRKKGRVKKDRGAPGEDYVAGLSVEFPVSIPVLSEGNAPLSVLELSIFPSSTVELSRPELSGAPLSIVELSTVGIPAVLLSMAELSLVALSVVESSTVELSMAPWPSVGIVVGTSGGMICDAPEGSMVGTPSGVPAGLSGTVCVVVGAAVGLFAVVALVHPSTSVDATMASTDSRINCFAFSVFTSQTVSARTVG